MYYFIDVCLGRSSWKKWQRAAHDEAKKYHHRMIHVTQLPKFVAALKAATEGCRNVGIIDVFGHGLDQDKTVTIGEGCYVTMYEIKGEVFFNA